MIRSSSIARAARGIICGHQQRYYATTPKIEPYTVLFYKYVPDVLEKRAPHRMAHMRYAAKAFQAGKLVFGGAFDPPKDGAMIVFKGDCRDFAEEFAKGDPYVTEKVVESYEIKPWSTIAFESPEAYQD